MSGSVSPEFGILLKVFVVLIAFLGIEYLAVVFKLYSYDHHSTTWKIIFGAITPFLIILSLVSSKLFENKTINVISVVLLTAINLIYLLAPVITYLAALIYNGSNKIITFILFGIISLLTFILILSSLASIIYWTIKLLKL
jgi:hypothetical protein